MMSLTFPSPSSVVDTLMLFSFPYLISWPFIKRPDIPLGLEISTRGRCEWQLEWDDRVNFIENPIFTLHVADNDWASYWRELWLQVWNNGSVLGVWEPLSLIAKVAQNEFMRWRGARVTPDVPEEMYGPAAIAIRGGLAMTPDSIKQVSTVIHAFNALLVVKVSRGVIEYYWRTATANREYKMSLNTRIGTAIGSLFWAVHPHRAEVVAWASGQPYLLATFFVLCSTLCFLESQKPIGYNAPTDVPSVATDRAESNSKGGSIMLKTKASVNKANRQLGPSNIISQISRSVLAGTAPPWVWYCFSLAAYGASLLSKAASIPLPGAFFLLLLSGQRGELSKSLPTSYRSRALRLCYFLKPLFMLSPFFALAAMSCNAALLSNRDVLPPFEIKLTPPYQVLRAFHACTYYLVSSHSTSTAAPIYPFPEGLPQSLLAPGMAIPAYFAMFFTCITVAWFARRAVAIGTTKANNFYLVAGACCAAWGNLICWVSPTLLPIQHGFPTIVAERYVYIPSALLLPLTISAVLYTLSASCEVLDGALGIVQKAEQNGDDLEIL